MGWGEQLLRKKGNGILEYSKSLGVGDLLIVTQNNATAENMDQNVQQVVERAMESP